MIGQLHLSYPIGVVDSYKLRRKKMSRANKVKDDQYLVSQLLMDNVITTCLFPYIHEGKGYKLDKEVTGLNRAHGFDLIDSAELAKEDQLTQLRPFEDNYFYELKEKFGFTISKTWKSRTIEVVLTIVPDQTKGSDSHLSELITIRNTESKQWLVVGNIREHRIAATNKFEYQSSECACGSLFGDWSTHRNTWIYKSESLSLANVLKTARDAYEEACDDVCHI